MTDADLSRGTEDMPERKAKMIELGDAFIALPGGTGTLEEVAEIMSMLSLGFLEAPCILYDHDGYYQPLREMLQRMVDHKFSTAERQRDIHFADSIAQISEILTQADAERGPAGADRMSLEGGRTP